MCMRLCEREFAIPVAREWVRPDAKTRGENNFTKLSRTNKKHTISHRKVFAAVDAKRALDKHQQCMISQIKHPVGDIFVCSISAFCVFLSRFSRIRIRWRKWVGRCAIVLANPCSDSGRHHILTLFILFSPKTHHMPSTHSHPNTRTRKIMLKRQNNLFSS